MYALTALSCQDVDQSTDVTVDDQLKAYEQAELFTKLGFEVSTPTSYDGETFTFTITR